MMNPDSDDLAQMIAHVLRQGLVVSKSSGASISYDKPLDTYTVKSPKNEDHDFCAPEDDEADGFDQSLAKEAVMHFMRLP